jgi:hypothetical protein
MSKRRVVVSTPLPKPTDIQGLKLDGGAYALLTPDERTKLDKSLEDDQKTRRQAEATSATLRLG